MKKYKIFNENVTDDNRKWQNIIKLTVNNIQKRLKAINLLGNMWMKKTVMYLLLKVANYADYVGIWKPNVPNHFDIVVRSMSHFCVCRRRFSMQNSSNNTDSFRI